MKKKIAIIVAFVLIFSVSATALAASDRAKEVTEENKGKALGIEKQETGVRGERLRELFAMYYPEGLAELEANQEAHKDFHESAKVQNESIREAVRADFEAIKEAVENGSISKRDGKVQMINLRIDIRNMRNEMDLIRLDKIEAQAPVHDRLMEIRQEIKSLLEIDPVDGDAVAALLEESLGLFAEHLDNDIYYHGLMMDVAAGYGY